MNERAYVTFLWNNGFRAYRPEHVNLLAKACKHFDPLAGFVCVTTEVNKFSPDVTLFKPPESAERMRYIAAPQGDRFPSSYRRLWLFSEEAKVLGDRIMLLDIDCMMVKDPASLWEAKGDFVGWRPACIWGREDRLGGGTWMLKTGTHTDLWNNFTENPVKMIQETREAGWNGSDQAILSRFLRNKDKWPSDCGIYAVGDGVFEWDIPPKNAIIVHFNGEDKPWNQDKLWMQAYCHYFGGQKCRL